MKKTLLAAVIAVVGLSLVVAPHASAATLKVPAYINAIIDGTASHLAKTDAIKFINKKVQFGKNTLVVMKKLRVRGAIKNPVLDKPVLVDDGLTVSGKLLLDRYDCAEGQHLTWSDINQDWGCSDDLDTPGQTYAAGDGLELSGSLFTLEDCGADEVLESDGSGWNCVSNIHDHDVDNLIVVAKSGGDFTSIQSALDSITDNAEDNQYLVLVGPGVYNEEITMLPYVDIEGAGEHATTINSDGGASIVNATVTITTGTQELRNLTVESYAEGTSNPYTDGIYIVDASPVISNVTVEVSDGTSQNYGIYATGNSSGLLRNVTIDASGSELTYYGVYDDGGSMISDGLTIESECSALTANCVGYYNSSNDARIENSRIVIGGSATNNKGIQNVGGVLTVRNSHIAARDGSTANIGVRNEFSGTVIIEHSQVFGSGTGSDGWDNASGATLNAVGSQMGGGYTNAGDMLCLYGYNDVFDALDSNCDSA